jgi:hypothetical protein
MGRKAKRKRRRRFPDSALKQRHPISPGVSRAGGIELAVLKCGAASIMNHDLRSFPYWVALKQQLQSGDQLWTFDSPKRFWRECIGRQGIVLVRFERFVVACTMAMN